MCCLLLAAKAWRPLSPKARHRLLLPQLLPAGGTWCPSRVVGWQEQGGFREGEVGEAKAAPLCQEGEEKTWMTLEALLPFPTLAASEHPTRTVGFKACGRREPYLTYGLKNAHVLTALELLKYP